MAVASFAHHRKDSPCLDTGMIDSLSSIMSKSAIRSLLIDMDRDVRERLDRVAEIQVAASSLAVIAQDAHDLRSMGGNFGMTELANRAAVVERAARSLCIETVRKAVPPMISIGHQSLAALSKRPEFTGGGTS